MVARWVWTGALVGITWTAFGVAVLTAPTAMPTDHLVASAFYLTTASGIAVLAHHHRYRLTTRESTARTGLEEEQERTRALLARLDRLSHEDPLTGLANRRRWDAELPPASGPGTPSPASAVTSSPSCCPAPTSAARSPWPSSCASPPWSSACPAPPRGR